MPLKNSLKKHINKTPRDKIAGRLIFEGWLNLQFANFLNKVNQFVRVTPLVIVP